MTTASVRPGGLLAFACPAEGGEGAVAGENLKRFRSSGQQRARLDRAVRLLSGCFSAGAILLITFALFETRTKYPLLPPRVVTNRTRGGSLIVMLFASIGTFGVFLFLTYYLQTTLGFTPVRTGIAFLPLIAALSVVGQISNRAL